MSTSEKIRNGHTDAPKRKKHRKHRGSTVLFILGIVFLTAFCYSTFKLGEYLVQSQREKSAFDTLSGIVEKDAASTEVTRSPDLSDRSQSGTLPDQSEAAAPQETPKVPLAKYETIYEMNHDFFGWLSIEGTSVDYPVVYTPDRPEYYLDRGFDGTFTGSGVPFIDERCPEEGDFYLIYGHHMQNKTMFGPLPYYAERNYYEVHPFIRFDTRFEEREYQVAAAFYSRVYEEDEVGVFRYYEYFDLTEQSVFDEYVSQVKAAAIYDTGVEMQYGDELLALSTCNYHTADGRFVVVAKRVS